MKPEYISKTIRSDFTKVIMKTRVNTYGINSMAVTVPKQLGFAVGDRIKVTFETVKQEVEE